MHRQPVGLCDARPGERPVLRLSGDDVHGGVLSQRRLTLSAAPGETLDDVSHRVVYDDERRHSAHESQTENVRCGVVHPDVPAEESGRLEGFERVDGIGSGDRRSQSAVRSTAARRAARVRASGQLRCVRAAGRAEQPEDRSVHRAEPIRYRQHDAAAPVAGPAVGRSRAAEVARHWILHRIYDGVSGEWQTSSYQQFQTRFPKLRPFRSSVAH